MSKKNNVRSSQLLSPFGVGQIVNFPKELSRYGLRIKFMG